MSDGETPDRPLKVRVEIIGPHDEGGRIRIDARQAGGLDFSIPTKAMGFIRLIHSEGGWDAVLAIMGLGAAIHHAIVQPDVAMTPENLNTTLAGTGHGLKAAADLLTRDRLLEETYKLLSERKINRNTAATIAQDVLQEKISADAWRKAVDKWALDNGKPKLDLPHGRPIKQKPEN